MDALHEKLDHSKNQLASCQTDHADVKGTHEQVSRVSCVLTCSLVPQLLLLPRCVHL
jgi:hypothetical protein